MEGMEKFERSEEWRERLKRNLCMERTINLPKDIPARIELGDLKKLLEKRRIQLENMDSDSEVKEDTKGKEGTSKVNWDANTFCASDESFAALEKMCDKTASDPNSTLFRYLHPESAKSTIVKGENAESAHDSEEEDNALFKLFTAFNAKNRQKQEIIDLTQLEDVEAPSALWDKSSENDTMLQTSPVKMVGLLRPSTIIEEAEGSPNVSVVITSEYAASESGESSSYETAQDNSENCELALPPLPKDSEEFHDASYSEVLDSVFDSNEPLSPSSCTDTEIGESTELLTESNVSQSLLKADQSVANDSDSPNFNDTIEEVEYMLKKGLEYIESGTSMSKSKLDVNSTKKTPMRQNTPCSELKKSNVKHAMFVKPNARMDQKTPISVKAKNVPSAKKENNAPTDDRYHFELKPIPKLNVFQKPSGIPTVPNLRRKPLHFNNIVSPVGTYMKNTAVTPFLISTQNKNNPDMHNSSAIRRLDTIEPKFKELNVCDSSEKVFSPRSLPKKAYISSTLKHVVDERTPIKVPGGKSIQKYIGNTLVPNVLRHDGKLKVPNAAGVSKLKPPVHTSLNESKTSGRKTDIKDLSIASGNVSVYTIKNARKF